MKYNLNYKANDLYPGDDYPIEDIKSKKKKEISNSAHYKKTKKLIDECIDYWKDALCLGYWKITWKEYDFSKKGNDEYIYANVHINRVHQIAKLEVNLDLIKDKTIDPIKVEQVIVHELVHIVLHVTSFENVTRSIEAITFEDDVHNQLVVISKALVSQKYNLKNFDFYIGLHECK